MAGDALSFDDLPAAGGGALLFDDIPAADTPPSGPPMSALAVPLAHGSAEKAPVHPSSTAEYTGPSFLHDLGEAWRDAYQQEPEGGGAPTSLDKAGQVISALGRFVPPMMNPIGALEGQSKFFGGLTNTAPVVARHAALTMGASPTDAASLARDAYAAAQLGMAESASVKPGMRAPAPAAAPIGILENIAEGKPPAAPRPEAAPLPAPKPPVAPEGYPEPLARKASPAAVEPPKVVPFDDLPDAAAPEAEGYRTSPANIATEHEDEVRQIETEAYQAAAAKHAPTSVESTPPPTPPPPPAGAKLIDPDLEPHANDVLMARSPVPSEPGLFDTIRQLGGMRPEPDTAALFKDYKNPPFRRRILDPNGLAPDDMRAALQQRGWFGRDDAWNVETGRRRGDDIQDMYDLLDREARGETIYHPESSMHETLAHRALLDEDLARAGVGSADDVHTAATKLRDYRQSAAADLVPNEAERQIDAELHSALSEDEWRSLLQREGSHANEPGADVGAEFEAPGSAEGARGEAGPVAESTPDLAASHPEAGGRGEAPADAGGVGAGRPTVVSFDDLPTEAGAEGLPQTIIPGAEQSARQLAAAREAAGHGRKASRVAQQDAGGLFGEKAPETGSLFEPEGRPGEQAPPFYSALTRGVEGLKMERAPAEQWRNTIKNLPGIKSEEVAWSGLDDFLASKTGPVTKAEVLQHLRENEVQVHEVEKGWTGQPSAVARERMAQHIHKRSFAELSARDQADVDQVIRENDFGKTKFDQYRLPGGENYRELLLTMPVKEGAPTLKNGLEIKQDLGGKWNIWDSHGTPGWVFREGFPSREEVWAAANDDKMLVQAPTNLYRSGHWSEPNVLAHVRFDDRTGPNGERILHVAEIQSDWHQAGRRKGYAGANDKAEFDRVNAELATARQAMAAEQKRILRSVGAETYSDLLGDRKVAERTKFKEAQLSDPAWLRADERVRELEKQLAQTNPVSKVPDAPFKSTWHELAMKRVLRYAAENGYDRVTWDTGATNAARYDLSKQLDRVVALKTEDGRYSIKAYDKGDTPVVSKGGMSPEQLVETVGKDLADKIVNGPTGRQTYSGLDLKVGGEGMAGFYDRILPQFVSKYAKKWGAKVETSSLKREGGTSGHDILQVLGVPEDQIGGRWRSMSQKERDRLYDEHMARSVPVHSVAITPQMRESVMQGQAMFEPASPQFKTPEFKRWFGASKVVDEKGNPLTVYHGSNTDIAAFDKSKTVDGGFHFGTASQANMRVAGNGKNLTPVHLRIENPMRSKDTGGNWKARIASAKSAGHDGIVYLNRYEGIPASRIEALSESGELQKLDRLTDAQFKKLVPEATDSYIAFKPEQVKSATGNRGTFDPSTPNIIHEPEGAHEPVARTGDGVATDLMDEIRRHTGGAENTDEAVAAYIRKRGAETGHEALAIQDAKTGDVFSARTDGSKTTVGFDQRIAEALLDPNNTLVSHHNHPTGRAISHPDLKSLGALGHRYMVVHGKNGDWYGAGLTEQTRNGLLNMPPRERANAMSRIVDAVVSEVYRAWNVGVQNLKLSANDATYWHASAIDLALHRAGIIDFSSSVALPEHLEEWMRSAISSGASRAAEVADSLGVRRDGSRLNEVYRPPGTVGYSEGIARVSERYRENPKQRPQDQAGAQRSQAGARQPPKGKVRGAAPWQPRLPGLEEGKPGSLHEPEHDPLTFLGRIRAKAAALMDPVRDMQMLVAPMSQGSEIARATAKDFANEMRKARYYGQRVDDYISKNFTREQQTRMWQAADEESVALQKGEPTDGIGLSRLTPEERAAVEAMQHDAQQAWDAAKAEGMVEGDGLPSYMPRMVVRMGEQGAEHPGAKEGPPTIPGIGSNLKTRTGQMKHREYLTTTETEQAAGAKLGPGIGVVQNVRTLPLATARLNEAIAGRSLINTIKEIGKRTGEDLVSEGVAPAEGAHRWFTIDHPAFKTWRPKLVESEATGKWTPVKDVNGQMVFEQVPLYVRDDFEGPLRAVLSQKSGPIYGALMNLKGRAMTAIMYSPLIHNAVEWGRALPAFPGKVASLKIYFEGNAAKRDPVMMNEAIDSGLVPIGHYGGYQDITSIANEPNFEAGRSWTAKALGQIPGMFDPRAKQAVYKAIDKMGDIWHNKLLWDRVGDLQMGLYKNFRDHLVKKGLDPQTAQRMAAHLANRYAGALPLESMSNAARKIANLVMFSRTFTLGNLGAMKDMFTGLPRDVQAQIARDRGPAELAKAKTIAQRKALGILAVDIGLLYAGNSLLQNAAQYISGRQDLHELEKGYVDRLNKLLARTKENPIELLNVFGDLDALSATAENEPGKEQRILTGYDKDGTAIYARNPAGKIGEEFKGWATEPLDMMKRKLGTLARPTLEMISNDRGFGRQVYNPNAKTPKEYLSNIGNIVGLYMGSQVPLDQLKAGYDLMAKHGEPETNALKIAGPLLGVTFSKGAPGGPAIGAMYAEQERARYELQQALPGIRDQIEEGDIKGARAKMNALGVAPSLQAYYIRTTRIPASRLSPSAMQRFQGSATPEEKARLGDLLKAKQKRQAAP